MINYYHMVYCDDASCRVNTFEWGLEGLCPGCGNEGFCIECHSCDCLCGQK